MCRPCPADHAVHSLQGYEPQVVLSKRVMPWFDERIYDSSLGRRLYGEHLHALGQGFVVHPTAFVMIQPSLNPVPVAAVNQKIEQEDVRPRPVSAWHGCICILLVIKL